MIVGLGTSCRRQCWASVFCRGGSAVHYCECLHGGVKRARRKGDWARIPRVCLGAQMWKDE